MLGAFSHGERPADRRHRRRLVPLATGGAKTSRSLETWLLCVFCLIPLNLFLNHLNCLLGFLANRRVGSDISLCTHAHNSEWTRRPKMSLGCGVSTRDNHAIVILPLLIASQGRRASQCHRPSTGLHERLTSTRTTLRLLHPEAD